METVAFLNDDQADVSRLADMTSIAAVARMGNEPHNQLTALRQFLGVNRLLHLTVPPNWASDKDKFQFISMLNIHQHSERVGGVQVALAPV